MENLEKIKRMLVDFFSLVSRYIIEIYQVIEGKSELSKSKPENYTYGQLVEKSRS